MENYNDKCYSNINCHPLTRKPDRTLDSERPVYVGANGKTKICKLVGDSYVAWDIYRDRPLIESYDDEIYEFCKFSDAVICRGLSGFDY